MFVPIVLYVFINIVLYFDFTEYNKSISLLTLENVRKIKYF